MFLRCITRNTVAMGNRPGSRAHGNRNQLYRMVLQWYMDAC